MDERTTSPADDIQEAIDRLLAKHARRTAKESRRYGKSLRKAVPRDVLASWVVSPKRPDPAELIFSQDEARVQRLVPVRHERMAVSPFTFYRGAALVMASDLSSLLTTGIEVQLCGDAHISNFGFFLSPERRTVFDINDFDETCRGPWEWDVARLAASVEVCGRDRSFLDEQRDEAVLAAVRGYREAMRKLAHMGNLEMWYAHVDVDTLFPLLADRLSKKQRSKAGKALDKTKQKNSVRAINKLTEVVDGRLRVKSDPPIVVPLRDIIEQVEIVEQEGESVPRGQQLAHMAVEILNQYRMSLPPERAALLDLYRGVDLAHKVVGVGSVGLRAWIVVLEGANNQDPLVLQIKEATDSVLERYVGKAPQANHGQRVVEGQHAMQTASDLLLGWTRVTWEDGRSHDYYVRQLWDGKGSIDLSKITATQLTFLAETCGGTLAHAHARTGDRHAIAAYLGKSDKFDQAVLAFSRTYADQNEKDYARFLEATSPDAPTRTAG